MRNSRLHLARVLPALVGLATWQCLVVWRDDYAFFIGSPQGIAAEFRLLLLEGGLLRDLGVTVVEAVSGFAIGTLVGTALGLSLWRSATAFQIASPYLAALGAVPVFALGPIVIFWLGTGISSKIVLCILATFLIALPQAYSGASAVDPNLLRMSQAFGAGGGEIFKRIVAPSALLWVLAGIRINIGMALLAAFVGEFISSNSGLGHLILVAEGLYNVNRIWVGVACIMLVAISLHSLARLAEAWATRWK